MGNYLPLVHLKTMRHFGEEKELEQTNRYKLTINDRAPQVIVPADPIQRPMLTVNARYLALMI